MGEGSSSKAVTMVGPDKEDNTEEDVNEEDEEEGGRDEGEAGTGRTEEEAEDEDEQNEEAVAAARKEVEVDLARREREAGQQGRRQKSTQSPPVLVEEGRRMVRQGVQTHQRKTTDTIGDRTEEEEDTIQEKQKQKDQMKLRKQRMTYIRSSLFSHQL